MCRDSRLMVQKLKLNPPVLPSTLAGSVSQNQTAETRPDKEVKIWPFVTKRSEMPPTCSSLLWYIKWQGSPRHLKKRGRIQPLSPSYLVLCSKFALCVGVGVNSQGQWYQMGCLGGQVHWDLYLTELYRFFVLWICWGLMGQGQE